MCKMIQSGGFLVSLLSKLAGPLMKVAVQLANILAPLRITAAASAIDPLIQKKTNISGTTILIVQNKKMNDIRKLFKLLLFIRKKLLKQLKMKRNNKKEDFYKYH